MSLTTRTIATTTADSVQPLWPATVIDPFSGTGEAARNAARLALRVPERARPINERTRDREPRGNPSHSHQHLAPRSACGRPGRRTAPDRD